MHRIEQKQYRKVDTAAVYVCGRRSCKNDMAGDEDSWKCELEEAGYEVRPILRGHWRTSGNPSDFHGAFRGGTMTEQAFCVERSEKNLRMGYTTWKLCCGCGKSSSQNAVFWEKRSVRFSLMTPKGIRLYLDVEDILRMKDKVRCAIRKDAGDDPDVTDQILVYAEVSKTEGKQITLDGGVGVGRITRKGLEQDIGDAAINKVPRAMIREAVEKEKERGGYTGGLSVIISIPDGAELAKKTFNPRLGIEGGLSVLGTTGIVEPMSEKALTDTIFLEMKMLRENGNEYCYLVPGNYGSDFLKEALGYDGNLAVKCSNYIGESIDHAVRLGMKGILLIGHVGKLIKVAAGVMNTHSRQADCRMEVFASHAAMAGADPETVKKIMESITTAEMTELLEKEQLLGQVMDSVMKRIAFYLKHRGGESLRVEAIVFSNENGILGETSGAEELLEIIRAESVKEKRTGEKE